jgi:hypothetical protein
MPGDSGVLVVTRLLLKRTRACGCHGHPAFPTPSNGGRFINGSGALRGEVAKSRLEFHVIASEAKQSISPRKKNGLFRRFAPRNDGL